jgi:hypothetical protein
MKMSKLEQIPAMLIAGIGLTLTARFASVVVVSALLSSAVTEMRGQTVTYDLSRDFSAAANPSGVWSYGWKSSFTGAFSSFSESREVALDNGVPVQMWSLTGGQFPMIYHNATTNTGIQNFGQELDPPGATVFNPGFDGTPQNFCVIRFTVPNQGSGNYQLESAVACYINGPLSGDTDYHVVVNGVEVFGRFLAPRSATGYTNTLALAAGDIVDLMVGRGADGTLFGSGLRIQATLSLACTPHKATATAQLVNGFLVGAIITDPGCGYTNAPTVLIQGGGGSGATATATVSGGQIIAINITSAGCCYTNAPRIVIGSPPFVPSVSVSVSKVNVTQNVVLGRNYVLESSPDLVTWTAVGPQFTAQSETIVTEFDATVANRFFRIRQVP